MSNFQKKIDEFNRKVGHLTNAEMKKIGAEILNRAVLNTPVDTGTLRANWQIAFDSASSASVSADVAGKGHQGTAQRSARFAKLNAASTLSSDRPIQSVHIFNNVEYAIPVEEGNENRRPVRMLARAVRGAMRT